MSMATHMKLKIDLQKVSKFEIFRNSRFRKLIFDRIISDCPRWYKWCWKQHSIIVADFQQKCCFSATNVDFSSFCAFIHVRTKVWMKKPLFENHFQNLSEFETFIKSKDFGLILIRNINMCSWCYIWCCMQHSIIVAHLQ